MLTSFNLDFCEGKAFIDLHSASKKVPNLLGEITSILEDKSYSYLASNTSQFKDVMNHHKTLFTRVGIMCKHSRHKRPVGL